MRDSSHTQALSASELEGLVQGAGLNIIHTASREVDVNVDRWLELTETKPEIRRMIIEELRLELDGRKKSGMRPVLRNHELMFQQTWVILVGEKRGSFSESSDADLQKPFRGSS